MELKKLNTPGSSE